MSQNRLLISETSDFVESIIDVASTRIETKLCSAKKNLLVEALSFHISGLLSEFDTYLRGPISTEAILDIAESSYVRMNRGMNVKFNSKGKPLMLTDTKIPLRDIHNSSAYREVYDISLNESLERELARSVSADATAHDMLKLHSGANVFANFGQGDKKMSDASQQAGPSSERPKEKRQPSVYNRFMKKALAVIKENCPEAMHKTIFKFASRLWKVCSGREFQETSKTEEEISRFLESVTTIITNCTIKPRNYVRDGVCADIDSAINRYLGEGWGYISTSGAPSDSTEKEEIVHENDVNDDSGDAKEDNPDETDEEDNEDQFIEVNEKDIDNEVSTPRSLE